MKDIPEHQKLLFYSLQEAIDEDNVYIWTVRDVKNKKDVIMIGTLFLHENGEQDIVPLAILPNEEDNLFMKYDFEYYLDKPITIGEEKCWWQFWR